MKPVLTISDFDARTSVELNCAPRIVCKLSNVGARLMSTANSAASTRLDTSIVSGLRAFRLIPAIDLMLRRM